MNGRNKKKIRCPVCGQFAKHLYKNGKLIGGACHHGEYVLLFGINRGW